MSTCNGKKIKLCVIFQKLFLLLCVKKKKIKNHTDDRLEVWWLYHDSPIQEYHMNAWQLKIEWKYFSLLLMQSSMGTLNSPSSRVVKDSTPSRRRILRYINFGIGESSPILFLDMMNLHLIIFKAWWILNERAFYCFIIFVALKWILT